MNPPDPKTKASASAATTGVGFISQALQAPVSQNEAALRPLSFDDFTGQPKTIERLKVVLAEAGCTLADVVKATVWLDDPRDFGPFNDVFRKHFGDAPPARSTLVSQLVLDGKVEIELVAYKPLAGGA